MSAEVYGEFAEDVYLVKPNNSPDKSVELAVTHFTAAGESVRADAIPVVLVHGLYQNKRLWASERVTLARSMVGAGFDVWLLEFRGHGQSPMNRRYSSNTMTDYARYDLPAVNMFVAEKTGKPVNWLGHGTGGGALLLSLALGAFEKQNLGRILGMGVPFYAANWSRFPGVASLLMARRLREDQDVGPEPEPMSLLSSLVKENHWFATRGGFAGVDLWRSLDQLGGEWSWLLSGGSDDTDGLDSGFKSLNAQLQHCLCPDEFSDLEFVGEGLHLWLEQKRATDLFARELAVILDVKEKGADVLSSGEASPAT